MPISIIDEFQPIPTECPVTDQRYVRGGYRSVSGIVDRDAIPTGLRTLGMEVYVLASGVSYKLIGTYDNTGWTNQTSRAYSSGIAGTGVVVTHGLGFYPNISVIDSSGCEIKGDIQHNSINQTRLGFSYAVTGIVYCT